MIFNCRSEVAVPASCLGEEQVCLLGGSAPHQGNVYVQGKLKGLYLEIGGCDGQLPGGGAGVSAGGQRATSGQCLRSRQVKGTVSQDWWL
jgi:hypothetical protein